MGLYVVGLFPAGIYVYLINCLVRRGRKWLVPQPGRDAQKRRALYTA